MVFKTMIALMIVASLLYLFSAEGFAIIILAYILYGPLRALRNLNIRKIKIKR
jgi:CDP-diacylglycerol--serine O-phosphatidyltransferase